MEDAFAFEFELEFESDFEFVLEFGSEPSKKALPGDPPGDASRAPQNKVPEDQVKLPPVYPHTVGGSVWFHPDPEPILPHTPSLILRMASQQLQLAPQQRELP